ncbi:peptidoglycan/LPS O-acetylase OafA/YrhL [Curtobacterium sp. PhB130]|uniref:acyltransferase family protein n=1 Tax=unclassified Curtobacterium TaxID=257496 RepID=UPI000F4B2024|nr:MULTISPECIES: acyltransferase [unclassified Curtobacterium]ROP65042.1 peptidoglycan/LPS O-acetylase OafA/YrhL [Curtobacterium sp. ZW137]ROS78357.1 peptidoglycan/LPS O-acetylase OafA/YrhL [Curtobacterium sp. PhB130]TCK65325.1 peptidoglycan/LPS O-acetylase OafA/YrhL [Curtobacterium sp. PhB136]
MSIADVQGRRSLGARFDPRRNSLNAIRLILAGLVVLSHSWPIGGYGPDPVLGDQGLGSWAVAGFFCISGYLITTSRVNSRSLVDFVWRRVLRIYPAFIVALVVVAFGIAPAVVAMFPGGGTWTFTGAAGYVFHDAFLYIRQYGITGTLGHVPYPNAWDASLWTLFFEFLCYLAIGFLVSLVAVRWRTRAVVALLVVCAAIVLLQAAGVLHLPGQIEATARLGGYFGGGALLYLQRDRIPVAWPLVLLAAALVVAVAALGVSGALVGVPLAYLCLVAGILLPLHWMGARNDVSYGLYIYGFPVQQTMVLAFPHQQLPVVVFAALSVVAALPFAWASWLFVERPAMRLKRVFARRPVDAEGHVEERSLSATPPAR